MQLVSLRLPTKFLIDVYSSKLLKNFRLYQRVLQESNFEITLKYADDEEETFPISSLVPRMEALEIKKDPSVYQEIDSSLNHRLFNLLESAYSEKYHHKIGEHEIFQVYQDLRYRVKSTESHVSRTSLYFTMNALRKLQEINIERIWELIYYKLDNEDPRSLKEYVTQSLEDIITIYNKIAADYKEEIRLKKRDQEENKKKEDESKKKQSEEVKRKKALIEKHKKLVQEKKEEEARLLRIKRTDESKITETIVQRVTTTTTTYLNPKEEREQRRLKSLAEAMAKQKTIQERLKNDDEKKARNQRLIDEYKKRKQTEKEQRLLQDEKDEYVPPKRQITRTFQSTRTPLSVSTPRVSLSSTSSILPTSSMPLLSILPTSSMISTTSLPLSSIPSILPSFSSSSFVSSIPSSTSSRTPMNTKTHEEIMNIIAETKSSLRNVNCTPVPHQTPKISVVPTTEEVKFDVLEIKETPIVADESIKKTIEKEEVTPSVVKEEVKLIEILSPKTKKGKEKTTKEKRSSKKSSTKV